MNCKEVIKLLKDDGWFEKDQKRKPFAIYTCCKNWKSYRAMHKGDIPKGTLHAILKQAGLK